MKKLFTALALWMLLPVASQAVMILDVNWSESSHPMTLYSVSIRDDVPGFDGAAAVLDGPSNSGLVYSGNTTYTSGVHRISWTAAMLAWDSQTEVMAMIVDNSDASFKFTGPVVLEGHPEFGLKRLWAGIDCYLGAWEFGTVYQFEIWMNLDAGMSEYFLNGNLVYTEATRQNADIKDLTFQRPYGGGECAIGNIQWEIMSSIPEPATMSLLGLGALAMVIRRKLRK